MARHSKGLYSGAVWPPPCKGKRNVNFHYFNNIHLRRTKHAGSLILAFTVANVKLYAFLVYAFVYLLGDNKSIN